MLMFIIRVQLRSLSPLTAALSEHRRHFAFRSEGDNGGITRPGSALFMKWAWLMSLNLRCWVSLCQITPRVRVSYKTDSYKMSKESKSSCCPFQQPLYPE